MTKQDYEKIKGEIADVYLKKFKDELGWFKSLTILPIEDKIKKIMISDKEITGDQLKDIEDLGRWRNVLGIMTPKIANDIFDFLKEKQSLLIQAETENKLEELKNEVVLGKVITTEEKDKEDNDNQKNNTTSSTSPENDGSETISTTISSSQEPEIEEKKEGQSGGRKSIRNGIVVGVTGATARKIMEKSINKINDVKLKNSLRDIQIESKNAKKEIKMIQNQINKAIEKSEDAAKNPKISKAMRKNLEKSSKKFGEVLNALNDDEVIDARDAWGKLGRDMPADLLDAVNPKTAKLLSELDDETLALIAKSTSTDEITEILTKKGIKNIDSKVLTILKEMDDGPNIQAFFKVLRFGKKLSPIVKGLSTFGALDLLFFGFDVRMWNESMNEAVFIAKVNEARASVRRERAYFELAMGAASLVLELGIILTCSSIGTSAGSVVPGLGNAAGFIIGAAIGVLVFTIQDMVNQLYYDKVEFYTQNKEDYIRKERTEIKQAILQCAKAQEVDVNPSLRNTALQEKGINTFQDAWEALIFQEELDKYDKGLLPDNDKFPLIKAWYISGSAKSDYIVKLSTEDKVKRDEEWEKMDKRIAVRMEYVKQYITKEHSVQKYERFMENIKANTGLAYIVKILGESDIYMEMNDPANEYLSGFTGTVAEYKKALGEQLKNEYPDEYKIFDDLYIKDRDTFEYLCTGINNYDIIDEKVYTESKLAAIKKHKEFIKKFYHYKTLGCTIEDLKNVTIDYTDYDYNYIERVLTDFDEIGKATQFNKQDAINYFSRMMGVESRLGTNFQVSPSTGQNIIYRMAREFHGYTGNNDMFELMSFYNEASDDIKGIYYDDEWMINNDENTFGGDRRYNQNKIMFVGIGVIPIAIINRFSTIDRDRNLDDIDKKNMTIEEVYNKFEDVLMLDSKVDVADKEAVAEFRARIKKIIEEEITAKSPEKKKEVEKEIVEYVKAQSKGIGDISEIAEDGSLTYTGTTSQGYVEIPYSLVIKAKRAKIGDVEKFLFKYEDGKMVAISSQQYIDIGLDFDQELLSYEKVTPLREKLTAEEEKVIAKVDLVKKRLNMLRGVESGREDPLFGGHEDEINIPVEIEREISKKVEERENLKESLLYLDIIEAKSKLQENWNTYYEYFNGTYMGMLATISQFSINNNLGNFARMSQAWARIGKERYKIDEKGEVNIDHLDLEDDEKEYILEYIQKSYQGEKKTVAQLLTSDDQEEKQKGERMLDQIMVSVFESEVLLMKKDGGNIAMINENKDSSDSDVEKRIQLNLTKNTYINVTDTLLAIDETKIVEQKQEIKKVNATEKEVYDNMNSTLAMIIDTMKNVDRGYGRGKIKFIPDDKESTDTQIVGIVKSRGASHKVKIDVMNKVYTIEGLEYTFQDKKFTFGDKSYGVSGMMERVYTVNLMNRIQGKYLKEHPEMVGKFFFGDFMYPNYLFADVNWSSNDTEILDGTTVASKFNWLYNNKTNQKTFLKVINAMK